jgi:hypothetical protein
MTSKSVWLAERERRALKPFRRTWPCRRAKQQLEDAVPRAQPR